MGLFSRRAAGCGCSAQAAGPIGGYETSFVAGLDPNGARTAERLVAFAALQNTGGGGTPPGFGPSGDPSRRFDGELGPRQDFGAIAAAPASPATFRPGLSRGLPTTKVPSRSLAAASPYSARAQFGGKG